MSCSPKLGHGVLLPCGGRPWCLGVQALACQGTRLGGWLIQATSMSRADIYNGVFSVFIIVRLYEGLMTGNRPELDVPDQDPPALAGISYEVPGAQLGLMTGHQPELDVPDQDPPVLAGISQ
ncbi:hypothetical protein TIFTF001_038857 [Ficus carica]|uniref:Uncharacterized protein n=1 Tax=Ficus carica TaxID=3494 RepID=A0AA88E821_FICCA|nr:hypothetical protein TIFTF001_038857 [Ficus carica]